jgi:hypothetical protein
VGAQHRTKARHPDTEVRHGLRQTLLEVLRVPRIRGVGDGYFPDVRMRGRDLKQPPDGAAFRSWANCRGRSAVESVTMRAAKWCSFQGSISAAVAQAGDGRRPPS